MTPNASASGRPVSRRTVASGLAWTAPAVAIAASAPAFAASRCSVPTTPQGGYWLQPTQSTPTICNGATMTTIPYTTTSGTIENQTIRVTSGKEQPYAWWPASLGGTGLFGICNAGSKPITAPAVGSCVTYNPCYGGARQFGDSNDGSGAAKWNDDIYVSGEGVGGAPTNKYTYHFAIQGNLKAPETYTVAFGKCVENVTFTLYDIDFNGFTGNANGNYQDMVWVSQVNGAAPAAGQVTAVTTNGFVTGNGTAADPWLGAKDGGAYNNSSSNNVTVTIKGPLCSFQLAYGNKLYPTTFSKNGQSVWLGPMTYTLSCKCAGTCAAA